MCGWRIGARCCWLPSEMRRANFFAWWAGPWLVGSGASAPRCCLCNGPATDVGGLPTKTGCKKLIKGRWWRYVPGLGTWRTFAGNIFAGPMVIHAHGGVIAVIRLIGTASSCNAIHAEARKQDTGYPVPLNEQSENPCHNKNRCYSFSKCGAFRLIHAYSLWLVFS